MRNLVIIIEEGWLSRTLKSQDLGIKENLDHTVANMLEV